MKSFIVGMSALVICSCSPLESPEEQASDALNEMSALVELADSLGTSYDKEQWEETDSLFSHLLEQSSKNDGAYLSEEEKKELGKLAGRYTAIRIQKSTEIIEDRLKEAGLWMEGFFEGIKEQLEEEN